MNLASRQRNYESKKSPGKIFYFIFLEGNNLSEIILVEST